MSAPGGEVMDMDCDRTAAQGEDIAQTGTALQNEWTASKQAFSSVTFGGDIVSQAAEQAVRAMNDALVPAADRVVPRFEESAEKVKAAVQIYRRSNQIAESQLGKGE